MKWTFNSRVYLLPFAIAILQACGESGSPADPVETVASVMLSPDSATLRVGQTQQLTATVRDGHGNRLLGKTIRWSTSSESTASVSEDGLVTAIAEGSATITATSDGRSGTAKIEVLPVAVAAVTIVPDEATIHVGENVQLAVTLHDAAGRVVTGRPVQWSSNTPSVAIVSEGSVTAVAEGQATITAASEGRSGTAQITVVPAPVASVTVAPDTSTLEVGQTRQLSVQVRDAAGNLLSGRMVQWTSSDETAATVTPDGLVTAIAEGAATITAMSENASGAAQVLVVRAPTDVSGIINSNTIWTREGSPYRLTGTVQIDFGATLVIEPGVNIVGQDNELQVFGQLEAVGTSSSKIQIVDLHIEAAGRAPSERHSMRLEFVVMSRGSFYRPTGNAIYGSFRLTDSELSNMVGHNNLLYVWYPTADAYIERNVFVNTGGISVGTSDGVAVYIRNNSFYEQRGHNIDSPQYMFAIQNWASYDQSRTVVEHNSFWSTDRVALRLPAGYADAALTAANNYWGTVDETTIQAMIFDRNDDLNSAAIVEYRPFLNSSHPSTPRR